MTSLPVSVQRRYAGFVRSSQRSFASRLASILGRTELSGGAKFAELRPATRFLMIGLTAWIGLVVLATAVGVATVEISAMRFPAWYGGETSPSTSEIRPASGFENILQRPLFARSRRGAPVAVSPVAPPPPVAPQLDRNITLKGVFINGARAKALLIYTQEPLGAWVQASDEISGWRVSEIGPDQVLLEAANEKLVVPLGVNGAGK